MVKKTKFNREMRIRIVKECLFLEIVDIFFIILLNK